MRLKQYERYQIDFCGKWVTAAGGFMGLSVFLRIVQYFGVHMITDFGVGDIVLHLAIPTLFSALFIYLLHGIRWNAPGVYGILGAAFCLLLIIWNFFSGNVLRIVASLIWYLIAGTVFLGTTAGYVPGRFLAFLSLTLPLGMRVLFYDLPFPAFSDLFGECADLCLIASLALFPFALIPGKKPEAQDSERKR